jgi:CPA2 family monovalent cation:H+ antiporter-2
VLTSLAMILCVAAATTVLFQKIRQPVVLGYIIAGLIVGPHVPLPVFADEKLAHEMSELGVVLLMFSLGLEFSVRKLLRVAPTAGIIAVIQCSLMIWLGYVTGRAFGWTRLESFFTGGFIAISSTTIIVRAFVERGIKGPIAELVFGVLIVEDLIAVVLLAVVTPIAKGAGLHAGALAGTVGRLAAFLVGMLVLGIALVPRYVRMIVRIGRAETTVVASAGLCFAFALLAHALGYSVALGSFLAGALCAESGEGPTLEHVMEPVRDLFAAVFFVAVGMLIDPVLVAEHWRATLVLTAVVVVGKLFGVTVGAFVVGSGVRASVQAGMSLAQIGEFSFIIVGVGVALGAVRPFLYPVAVAVSALTTLITPWLIRASGSVAAAVERRLPHPLQTLAALYGTWLEGLRSTGSHRTAWGRIRQLAALLLVDEAAIAAIIVGTGLGGKRLALAVEARLGLSDEVVRWLVVGAATVVAAPFALGSVRLARALGGRLAAEALPAREGGADLGAAPRRALVVTLQLGILLAAGIPLATVTEPFAGAAPGLTILGLGLLALVIPLWRSATNLDDHVRAGAQVILEALARQTREQPAAETAAAPGRDLRRLVPGLGDVAAVRLSSGAPAVGRTLRDLDLRARTGAMVIAIERAPGDVLAPAADVALRESDVLVLSGAQEAVDAARALILDAPKAT